MLTRISIKDRLDQVHIQMAESGKPLRTFLNEKYIPRDSVICYVNGDIVDDQNYVIDHQDTIVLDMVRAYQLPEYCRTLRLWEDAGVESHVETKDSLYTKRMLWFQENGVAELKSLQMNGDTFIRHIDDIFVDGIHSKNLIEKGDTLLLALSGGRDSLALLYLLQRNKNRLPPFNLVGVTVAETAAAPEDIIVAKEAMASMGVKDHTVLDIDYVNQTMGFKHGFESAISKVLHENGRGRSITLWHTVMRANVERFARKRGIEKLSFGYHFEDLFTSVFRSYTLGVVFGESVQKKMWGDFTLVSPLFTIMKKELTLYLKLVAPQTHSRQGSPTDYDRGDHNRDINYFMADLLSGVYPGVGFSFFESLERMHKNYDIKQPEFEICSNCEITYSHAFGEDMDQREYKHVCSHCSHLISIGEIALLNPV